MSCQKKSFRYSPQVNPTLKRKLQQLTSQFVYLHRENEFDSIIQQRATENREIRDIEEAKDSFRATCTDLEGQLSVIYN